MNKKLMMTFLIAFAIFSVGMQMEGCCNCFGTCDDDNNDKHTQQATVCADADGDDFGKLYFAGSVPLGADTLPGGCGLNARDCDDTNPEIWEVCDGAWIRPPLPADTIDEKVQYDWQVNCVLAPELVNPIGATFDIMLGDSVNGIAGDDNLNTCKGKIENDQLDGQADYIFTPPEEQGGDTCFIHVGCKITWDENNDGKIDADTEIFTYVKTYEVFVREINTAPVFNTPPTDAPVGCFYIFPQITMKLNFDPEAKDEDLPRTLATDPGYFTCAITQDTCLVKNSGGQMVTWMTVDNSCHLVGNVPGYDTGNGQGVKPGDLCSVTVRATDGWGAQTNQTYDVWYIDPNTRPTALMEINHIFSDECEVDLAYDPVIFDPDQPDSCEYQPGWYKCELRSNSCEDILALDPNTCILHYRDVYNGGSPVQVANRETWGGRDCVVDFQVTDGFAASTHFQYTVYISECDNASPLPIVPGPVFTEMVTRNDIPLFNDIDLPPAGLDCEVNDACFIICDVLASDPKCDPWLQVNKYGCTISGTPPEYTDWTPNDFAGQVANPASGDCCYKLRYWDGADWDHDPEWGDTVICINVIEDNKYPVFNNKILNQTVCDGDPEETGGYYYDPLVADPDQPGTIPQATITCSFSYVSTPLCASWLKVNPTTCVVYGVPDEKHVQGDVCSYKLTAADAGTPSLSTSFVVNLTINECNQDPYWLDCDEDENPPEDCRAPVDLRVMPGERFNLVNGIAYDNDLPDDAASNPGALTCAIQSKTCYSVTKPVYDLPITVTNYYDDFPNLKPVGCKLDFTAPTQFGKDYKEVCDVTLRVTDGQGAYVDGTFRITIGCITYVDASKDPSHYPPTIPAAAPGPFFFSEGVSWRFPHDEIQEAVDWADWYPEERECEVWVAQGDYYQPTHQAPFLSLSPYLLAAPLIGCPDRVVDMAQGVDVIGAFQGYEHLRTERGSAFIYETTLSNECVGVPVVNGMPDAELSGLILQLGDNDQGGGLYYTSTSAAPLIVSGCIFENNTASQGGGIFVNGQDSAVMDIRNCVFHDNIAEDSGGAIYSMDIDLPIKNSLFVSNLAANNGGAVYVDNTTVPPSVDSVSINNCTFAKNKADKDNSGCPAPSCQGGAIYNYRNMTVTVKDTIFAQNGPVGQAPNIYTFNQPFVSASVTNVSYSLWETQQPSDLYTGVAFNLIGYNPYFVIDPNTNDDAPEGAYFLSQTLSAAINAGSANATTIYGSPVLFCTNTTYAVDTGLVDIGFHYPSTPYNSPFDQ